MTDKLLVSEIFYSIDGEGSRTGAPAIFIRLFGCNLDCTYCDSRYACKTELPGESCFKQWMTLDEIINGVEMFDPCRCITLTGGEPLLQPMATQLISRLRSLGYWVNIETNGSIDLSEVIKSQGPRRSEMDYFFTMDWKSLSSGESDKMLASNLPLLTTNDVLKFVVGSEADLDQMKEVLESSPALETQVYVSPVWGEISPAHIVEYILNNKLTYVKVQVQLHKIIWAPDKRGV